MDAPTVAAEATSSPPAKRAKHLAEAVDVVAKFKRPIMQLMLEFGDELLDGVQARADISVEDARRELLDPLRQHLAQLAEEEDTPPTREGGE